MDRIKANFGFRQSDAEHKPWLLEFRSSTLFITLTVATAVFTDIFLYAMIVPVFPFSLTDRVGIAPDDVQRWLSILLSVYGIGLLIGAPVCGWLSDRITYRRSPLLFGVVTLLGSTLMLCLARSVAVLVVARLIQGASAGIVWVVALAMLADTVGKEKVGQAMGYVATAYSLAALLGPLLGGIVYDKAGYYAVFAMAFGTIALDVIFRILLVEKKVARKWLPKPDQLVIAAVEVQNSKGVDTLGLHQDIELARLGNQTRTVEAKHTSESRPTPQPSMLTQGAAEPSTTTVDHESQNVVKKKLPPILILLKSARMQATFWACTVDAAFLTAFDTTLPLFVETTFGWNSLGAGLVFLAPLSPTFLQPLYGSWIDKHGARWPAFMGLVLTVPAWALLRLITFDSLAQKVGCCVILVVLGFGVSLTLAATMAEFAYICEEKERKNPGSLGKGGAYAQSYGLFNVSWALGSLIGAYWAGGIRAAYGWPTMTWTLALLAGVVSIPTLLYCGGKAKWLPGRHR